MSTNLPV